MNTADRIEAQAAALAVLEAEVDELITERIRLRLRLETAERAAGAAKWFVQYIRVDALMSGPKVVGIMRGDKMDRAWSVLCSAITAFDEASQ